MLLLYLLAVFFLTPNSDSNSLYLFGAAPFEIFTSDFPAWPPLASCGDESNNTGTFHARGFTDFSSVRQGNPVATSREGKKKRETQKSRRINDDLFSPCPVCWEGRAGEGAWNSPTLYSTYHSI
ncbi:hypothetical protein F4810DRAFT_686723, partial [Camillea tinctor]